MSLKSSIPVRFTSDVNARLKAVSEKTGIPVSQLVREATEVFLRKIETDGKVVVELREEPPSYGAKKAAKEL
jgi:predicted DNA-binding protein